MEPNTAEGAKSTGLIVLGMHRSGTSTVTGLLRHCGAWLGKDEELLAPLDENPKGFFERLDLHAICQKLLYSAGSVWWSVSGFRCENVPTETLEMHIMQFRGIVNELSQHGLWAMKEPTLCLLLPLLKPSIPSAVYILPIRNPVEIAKSLRRRNNLSLLHGIALWEVYTRHALASSADGSRVIVYYSEIVDNAREASLALIEALRGFGVRGLNLSDGVTDFVTAELRHEVADEDEVMELLSSEQWELWENLQKRENLSSEGERSISNRTASLLRDLELQTGTFRIQENLSAHQIWRMQEEAKSLMSSYHDTQSELGTQRRRAEVAEAEASSHKTQCEQLMANIAERERQLAEVSEDRHRQQALASELRADLASVRLQTGAELKRLRRELEDARLKPLKSIRRKVVSWVLYSLAKRELLFPRDQRERLYRSARKRDPRRDSGSP